MKYCEHCGKQLKNKEQCTCEEAIANSKSTPNAPNKKSNYIIIGAVVVLAIILIAVFSLSSKTDPFDFINVSFDGYNTQGTAIVEFDKDGLVCDIVGEEPDGFSENGFEEYLKWEEKYSEIYNDISLTCTPENGLSNNNKVVVEVKISGKATKKVKTSKKTFTVSGLREVKTVDLFKDIELVFSGVSGEASAEVVRKTQDDVLISCSFNIEPKYNLKNGDTVVVTIDNFDDLAQGYNVIPSVLSKEFKVEGLGTYLSSVEQIPEDIIKTISEQYLSDAKASIEDDFIFTHSEPKYYKTYLFVGKEDATWLMSKNELHFFATYDRYSSGNYHSTIYEPLVFKNVFIDSDGKVILNYEDGESSTFTTDMSKYISDKESNYIVVQIN